MKRRRKQNRIMMIYDMKAECGAIVTKENTGGDKEATNIDTINNY